MTYTVGTTLKLVFASLVAQSVKNMHAIQETACILGVHRSGDRGLIPGSGRSAGEGNGNLLQYSCLGNPINKGTWQATVHGVQELDMI